MKIYTHRTKNNLTAWAQTGLGAWYRPSYPLKNFLSEALSANKAATKLVVVLPATLLSLFFQCFSGFKTSKKKGLKTGFRYLLSLHMRKVSFLVVKIAMGKHFLSCVNAASDKVMKINHSTGT